MPRGIVEALRRNGRLLGRLHSKIELSQARVKARLVTDELETLDCLWREYVQADPATLTEDAKELAERVRQKVRELAGAEALEAERDMLKARIAEMETDRPTTRTDKEANVKQFRSNEGDAGLRGYVHMIRARITECDVLKARVSELEAERDALKADLLELAESVWIQWGFLLSDGRRDAGGLSTLEMVEETLRRHGRINERGRFAWEEDDHARSQG